MGPDVYRTAMSVLPDSLLSKLVFVSELMRLGMVDDDGARRLLLDHVAAPPSPGPLTPSPGAVVNWTTSGPTEPPEGCEQPATGQERAPCCPQCGRKAAPELTTKQENSLAVTIQCWWCETQWTEEA